MLEYFKAQKYRAELRLFIYFKHAQFPLYNYDICFIHSKFKIILDFKSAFDIYNPVQQNDRAVRFEFRAQNYLECQKSAGQKTIV